jgi:hypothetical protein
MHVCLLVSCQLLPIDYTQTPSSQETLAKPPSITFKMHVAGVEFHVERHLYVMQQIVTFHSCTNASKNLSCPLGVDSRLHTSEYEHEICESLKYKAPLKSDQQLGWA